MGQGVQQPEAPSMGEAFGRTIDLAQQVATDELRLVQLESQDRLIDAIRSGAWVGFGAFCLVAAWVAGWAAVVVSLEGRFSLEARLAMLAISQLALGAALVGYGRRSRPVSP
jgi:hypothetical protein